MKPTRPSIVVLLIGVAGAISYVALRLASNALPTLQLTAPALLAVLAVVESAMAYSVRARLAGRARPIQPIAVARVAALAKASTVVSAVCVGGYAGLLGWTVPSLAARTPGHDAVVAIVGIVGAGALLIAALTLERVCRVRPPPPGDDGREDPGI